MKRKKENRLGKSPKIRTLNGRPKTVFDAVNMFGTYNVQKTSETENEFPKIAQGLPEDEK